MNMSRLKRERARREAKEAEVQAALEEACTVAYFDEIRPLLSLPSDALSFVMAQANTLTAISEVPAYQQECRLHLFQHEMAALRAASLKMSLGDAIRERLPPSPSGGQRKISVLGLQNSLLFSLLAVSK